MEIQENVASETEVKTNESADLAKGKDNKRNAGQGGRRLTKDRNFGRKQEEKLYEEKVVKVSRVAKTVKGGKRIRFTALVCIGDKKGKFGFGLGKSNEVPDAIKKAVACAKKNLHTITISKGNTVAHSIMGHFGATKVFLKPASEGTGLVAGGAVRTILELAGIKNVYSKIYGSRTQSNVIKATVDGLTNMKSYKDVQEKRYGKVFTSEPEATNDNE